jgi:hypothetical protein
MNITTNKPNPYHIQEATHAQCKTPNASSKPNALSVLLQNANLSCTTIFLPAPIPRVRTLLRRFLCFLTHLVSRTLGLRPTLRLVELRS